MHAILENADNLKSAAILLLEKSVEEKDEARATLVAYAENMLFAFIDEVGKFYLIKSLYPKNLNHINLRKAGFYSHDSKINALVSEIRNKQARGGQFSPLTRKQALQTLKKFKEDTLYIDFKEGKIIKPIHSSTLNSKNLQTYVELIKKIELLAKEDFNNFKNNPL